MENWKENVKQRWWNKRLCCVIESRRRNVNLRPSVLASPDFSLNSFSPTFFLRTISCRAENVHQISVLFSVRYTSSTFWFVGRAWWLWQIVWCAQRAPNNTTPSGWFDVEFHCQMWYWQWYNHEKIASGAWERRRRRENIAQNVAAIEAG